MGPDGGQLGGDSGFVLTVMGLDKTWSFQNSLGSERKLDKMGRAWKLAISLGNRQSAGGLLGGGSACHMLSLESCLCVPSLNGQPSGPPWRRRGGAVNQPGGGSIASLMSPGDAHSPYLFWLRRFWTDWWQLSCRCLGRLGSQGLVFVFL